MTAIYRAEVIGSLLRPDWLKEARKALAAGTMTMPAFKKIEDRAVDEAVAQQEAAGVDIVTDGELRRGTFLGPLTDFVDGFSFVGEVIEAQSHWRRAPETKASAGKVAVTGKLKRRRSLAAEEFTYLRARAKKPIKATLPSPLMMALLWSPKHSSAAYPDPFTLFADATDILRQEVAELAGLGCDYIQIDAPELAKLVDPATRANFFEAHNLSPERLLGEGIDMLNAVADAPGVTFGLHLCRGNNAGQWMAEGGYDAISKQVFTRADRYGIFLLEYDDWRSGSFEPLADVPRDKTLVLGLISTKSDALEPADGVAARVEEAARFFPREQMALSTQCGFASVLAGNPIKDATQPAKLKLVADVAHRIWR